MYNFKTDVEIRELYKYMVGEVRNGKSPYLGLSLPRTALFYYVNKAKRAGAFIKVGFGVWQLGADFEAKTDAEIIEFIVGRKILYNSFSVGARGGRRGEAPATKETYTEIHALNILIPITKGPVELAGGYEVHLNHWVQRVKRFPNLGATLVNNNNQSLTLQVWSRRVFSPEEIPALASGSVMAVVGMLARTCPEAEIDYFSWKVNGFHIFMEDTLLSQVMNKAVTLTVALGRTAGKIGPEDTPNDAKAWTDPTPRRGLESNDLEYYKDYIRQPVTVRETALAVAAIGRDLVPAIQEVGVQIKAYGENIKLHLEVEKAQRDNNALMNRLLKRIDGHIAQRRLSDFG